ncbi:hypothetical protein M409DRAFT_66203 [Zasmidium cellare ATCC 36951]|uniref:UspA domain-containing protein n=1 Tax=Zasmidium cellare ATCC 36951 TaxID=1080233 RepID=A0A6A6CIV1_ZASCE|nr:uncharacterized protein M409DRAFT_66203 [Zasmidium cellare ATCC 36951]KAF2167154.1 hypothetical protein M409DRAFT_66203 [Zasmidium cellare ATCC 36951]
MSAEPSPRSGTPVNANGSIEPSPHSQLPTNPATATILPDRSMANAPLENASSNSTTSAANAASTFVPPWRRPTITIDGQRPSERRASVQFVPHAKDTGSRSSSAKPPTQRKTSVRNSMGQRRMSSPPPPPQFRPSVSFDTFANPAASDFSLTLNRKHRDYVYTKRSRTFLCGTDTNDYSDTALEWLIDELVDDGDEVVCLRVVEKDSKEATKWSAGQGEKGYRREAAKFMEEIQKKNTDDRAISLVLEFSIGKVHDTIQQMIRIYEPAILVVGTRGRSLTGYQGLLSSGSVSKYCLQYSPVPVIVVRPSSKREAKKKKRLQDPSRGGYRDILDKSEDAPRGKGGHLLDVNNRMSIMSSNLGALGEMSKAGDEDDEARRVAEAIGYRSRSSENMPNHARGSSLSRIASAQSDRSGRDDVQSPPGRLLKSPELGVVDSPPGSDEEDEGEDEDLGALQESIRPEDEAAMLAYERAQQVYEEEQEEAVARSQRSASRQGHRSGSRGRQRNDDEEGGGAAVLDIFEKLNRGIKS